MSRELGQFSIWYSMVEAVVVDMVVVDTIVEGIAGIEAENLVVE
jgi:hypothetical protein